MCIRDSDLTKSIHIAAKMKKFTIGNNNHHACFGFLPISLHQAPKLTPGIQALETSIPDFLNIKLRLKHNNI